MLVMGEARDAGILRRSGTPEIPSPKGLIRLHSASAISLGLLKDGIGKMRLTAYMAHPRESWYWKKFSEAVITLNPREHPGMLGLGPYELLIIHDTISHSNVQCNVPCFCWHPSSINTIFCDKFVFIAQCSCRRRWFQSLIVAWLLLVSVELDSVQRAPRS